jgi:hypothetical protein
VALAFEVLGEQDVPRAERPGLVASDDLGGAGETDESCRRLSGCSGWLPLGGAAANSTALAGIGAETLSSCGTGSLGSSATSTSSNLEAPSSLVTRRV